MTHLEIVKNNSISCQNINKKLSNIDFNYQCLVFDTESCAIERNNKSAKVYGFGVGCVKSDKMIYGQNLEQFFELCQVLFLDYCKKFKKLISIKKDKKKGYPTEKYVKIPMGVHNLVWDCEFLKYGLIENGFNYKMAVVEKDKSGGKFENANVVNEPNTFHIVQNDGIVYGTQIFFDYSTEIINRDGSITKLGLCLDIFDTYKIITCAESSFHKYTHGINPMFYKMTEEYDYETIRKNGHIQTDLELKYQYNDIYMLKETIDQFYIKMLMGGEMPKNGCRTASSIAFKKLKEMTFGEEKTEERYKEYFELDKLTTFEGTRLGMESDAYSGGYTHANSIHINKTLEKIGNSLDINSSYPSQMAYEFFPYGRPEKSEFGIIPEIDKSNQVYLVQIGFDFVRPKCKEYDLPIFKIYANNIKRLSKIVGDISCQEYFSTNITNEGEIILVEKGIRNNFMNTKYNMVVTNYEYEFYIKHFDFGCFERNELGFPIESIECQFHINDNSFNGLDIGEVLIYKAEKGKFKNFVDYFTKMKVEAKLQKNTPLSNQAKLFLNSSYGKFGTKTEKKEQNLIMDKNGILTFTSDDEVHYTSKEFYKPYAIFVTSYGRLKLWNAIIHCVGVENFLYTDTDSIYFHGELERVKNNLESIGEKIDKTELGAWDKEHTFSHFKVLGQKKYMFKDIDEKLPTIKCCGLPSVAREQLAKNTWSIVPTTRHKVVAIHRGKIIKKVKNAFDEFRLGKEVTGKKQKRRVMGGCLLLDTVYKIKKVAW